MQVKLSSIRPDYPGFKVILALYGQMDGAKDCSYDLDMSAVSWLEADMCAPLGALLHKRRSDGLQLSISNVNAPSDILRRNGFLQQFGYPKVEDWAQTTIEYRPFERAEIDQFKEYVARHFRERSMGLPEMTPRLLKKFRETFLKSSRTRSSTPTPNWAFLPVASSSRGETAWSSRLPIWGSESRRISSGNAGWSSLRNGQSSGP